MSTSVAKQQLEKKRASPRRLETIIVPLTEKEKESSKVLVEEEKHPKN